ncbi:hypothetical protein SAMN05444007_103187 [Cribrihabitans marinus]|uniref:Uncharacterized protein n=1 Tax=Cribrihabitans marinus TaxID=1227549 RepID=A0A1H6VH50_9RHOB|nr:hypothetical protein [Cribrihabitans marinus]GGH25754.1 hypothetical protein GCM10010973_13100 [Cribrihabitans marinus]SEJ03921.1 hypothetical protein SAMN05444007_103187 [Cribrihabitans marinus]
MSGWRRITTRADFCDAVVDRVILGDGLRFVIGSDATISGQAHGVALSGVWTWNEGYFCRNARVGEAETGKDCEVIEVAPGRMRYTRDRGRGASVVVTIPDA